ncbi:MAG: hypothetical protein AAGB24_13965 [Bacteroidota bacterium]
MLRIKPIMTVLFALLLPIVVSAQKIRDKKLQKENKRLIAETKAMMASKTYFMPEAYDKLRDREKKYDEKIGFTANVGTSPVLVGVLTEVSATKSLITQLKNKVTTLEAIPPFIHFGLKQIKDDLDREEDYLQLVEDDLEPLDIILAAKSGGVGYTYSFWLKLFLRTKRIRSNLQEIQYRLDNLNMFTKVIH